MKSVVLFGAVFMSLLGVACSSAPTGGETAQGYAHDPNGGNCAQLTVSIQRTSAAGTVTSDIGGINCTPDCSKSYDLGVTVALTAHPFDNWRFDHWSGDCSGTSATTSVALDLASKVCDAVFAPIYPDAGAPPAEDAGTTSTDVGSMCCAPKGSKFSFAACPTGGEKCCVVAGNSAECTGSGGIWMTSAACNAAGPTC
jgi:hypothetical protein